MQLGNVFLLLMLISVAVTWTSTEPKVLRNYVIGLWVADIGHIWITMYALGIEGAFDITSWNSAAWGNIGITVS